MNKQLLIAAAALAVMALPVAAVANGVAGYIEAQTLEQARKAKAESFDYASCDLVLERIDQADFDYWREIVLTPENRWCVRA